VWDYFLSSRVFKVNVIHVVYFTILVEFVVQDVFNESLYIKRQVVFQRNPVFDNCLFQQSYPWIVVAWWVVNAYTTDQVLLNFWKENVRTQHQQTGNF
jgi:hypothetical protein